MEFPCNVEYYSFVSLSFQTLAPIKFHDRLIVDKKQGITKKKKDASMSFTVLHAFSTLGYESLGKWHMAP